MNADPNRTAGRLSVEVEEGEYTLSLMELLAVLRRRVWVIVLCVVFFAGSAVGISFLQTPQYEASITVLVGQDQGLAETPNDALGIQTLTQTVAATVSSNRVAEAVIEDLDLQITTEDFLENLSVEQVPDTQLVEVSYRDPSANDAQLIVNTIGEEFSQQIEETQPDSSGVTAVTWDEATLPDETVSPELLRNGLLGLAGGIFVGLILVALTELLDDSWRSPEEIERISGVPTFGVIPQFESVKPRAARKKQGASTSSQAADKKDKSPYKRHSQTRTPGEVSFGETASWPYFGTVLLDRQGRIQKSNPTFAQMLGVEEKVLRGENITSFATHPDDIKSAEPLQLELTEGKRNNYQIEKRLITNEGKVVWVQLSVSKMEVSSDAEFAFGTIDDISQRKQAEEELRLSEEARRSSEARLSAFMERSPFAVRTFSEDGQPLMNGGAWDDFWGLNGEDEHPSGGGNLFEDEIVKRTGLLPYIRSAITSGELVTTPELPLDKKGNANGDIENAAMESSSRWFRAFITPISDESERISEIVVALSDITENKQIEERLHRAREEQQDSANDLELREKVLREREAHFRSLVEFATNMSNGDKERENE